MKGKAYLQSYGIVLYCTHGREDLPLSGRTDDLSTDGDKARGGGRNGVTEATRRGWMEARTAACRAGLPGLCPPRVSVNTGTGSGSSGRNQGWGQITRADTHASTSVTGAARRQLSGGMMP
ncbi:unnamed protein product [Calypogeia fissa]